MIAMKKIVERYIERQMRAHADEHMDLCRLDALIANMLHLQQLLHNIEFRVRYHSIYIRVIAFGNAGGLGGTFSYMLSKESRLRIVYSIRITSVSM